MTDKDLTEPEAVERLIVWLMDAHGTGNTEKNPEAWRTLESLSAERDALRAELAEAVGALQKIESRPDKMTWGEDYEVSEAMRDMEETARAFLARQKETDT